MQTHHIPSLLWNSWGKWKWVLTIWFRWFVQCWIDLGERCISGSQSRAFSMILTCAGLIMLRLRFFGCDSCSLPCCSLSLPCFLGVGVGVGVPLTVTPQFSCSPFPFSSLSVALTPSLPLSSANSMFPPSNVPASTCWAKAPWFGSLCTRLSPFASATASTSNFAFVTAAAMISVVSTPSWTATSGLRTSCSTNKSQTEYIPLLSGMQLLTKSETVTNPTGGVMNLGPMRNLWESSSLQVVKHGTYCGAKEALIP